MARYPDLPRPASPYPYRNNRPFVAGGSEWVMQARGLTRFPLLECDVTYRAKSWLQLSVLQTFFDSVNGAAGRFTFVDFNGIGPIGGSDPGVPWKGLFVRQGTGTGTGPWDLPTFGIQQFGTLIPGSYSAGANTIIPGIAIPGLLPGNTLTAVNADGTNGEEVTVLAVYTTGNFDVVLGSNKASNWYINAPLVYENGVAKVTEWNTTSPAAGHYGIKVGTGTDGVDSLYAGTTTPDGTIVTISAQCRRAMRRARFVAAKRAYTYNVPQNYVGETFTIAEVTK